MGCLGAGCLSVGNVSLSVLYSRLIMDKQVENLARRLQAWGLSGVAAAFLENAGPLAFLGAHALYFTGPVLSPFLPGDDVTALARLLEDPAAVRAFAERLTEAEA
jgi:hypothetical protein